MTYQLIDSGGEQKLERFGEYTLIRPCPQAIWRPLHLDEWTKADASFSREPENRWHLVRRLPLSWVAEIGNVRFKIAPTDFGHLGAFPEHAQLWTMMRPMIREKTRILNLFAYSGGVTLAAAQEGASVCHLDASKGMVEWARENAQLNRLEKAPIRWIVDDAVKFLRREIKRSSFYEGIVIDPPTFGRGSKGEVFKIERDLGALLELCREVLSPDRKFLILSCHTPGITPIVLQNIVQQIFGPERVSAGEMTLQSGNSFSIPSGCYAVKAYG
jgi:23S rRNA (cytosine1962-C5)-methyltransferase